MSGTTGAGFGATAVESPVPNGRWFHVLVPVMVLCIVSYMDRTNIGFAIPGGMSKDLAMSASFAGLAAGIFFIGYLFLQVPGGALAARGNAKRFLTWSMVAWGVISIATSYITSETQLLVLRFALGVAEGGMLPVVLTMVARWFPDEERARATAITIMFVPIANIISGPIAGLIIQNFGWRNLFLFEGIASFVLILPWIFMSRKVRSGRRGSHPASATTSSAACEPNRTGLPPSRPPPTPRSRRSWPTRPCGSSSS